MIEVFKTNVSNQQQANWLIVQIQGTFRDYTANFDLEDCDKILRVKCTNGFIEPSLLIYFLSDFGFKAEVLPDDDELICN